MNNNPKAAGRILSANLTVKGQVTIPKEVRERLHLKQGDKVIFEVKNSGEVVVKKGILAAFDNLVETLSAEAKKMGYTPKKLAKDLKVAEAEVWDKYYGRRE